MVKDQEFHDIVTHAVVKLFPEPANPHRADLFRSAPTDKDGRFVIKNVVPGRYRALAIMRRPGNETSYDDYVTASAAGVKVNLEQGESKSLGLMLFAAHR